MINQWINGDSEKSQDKQNKVIITYLELIYKFSAKSRTNGNEMTNRNNQWVPIKSQKLRCLPKASTCYSKYKILSDLKNTMLSYIITDIIVQKVQGLSFDATGFGFDFEK